MSEFGSGQGQIDRLVFMQPLIAVAQLSADQRIMPVNNNGQ